MMKEQIEKRLESLKQELVEGQKAEAELQQKLSTLQQTLLRISGAAQVLEEELAREQEEKPAE